MDKTIENHAKVMQIVAQDKNPVQRKKKARKNQKKRIRIILKRIKGRKVPKKTINFLRKIQELQSNLMVKHMSGQPTSSPRFFIRCTVGDVTFLALLDSGASVNLITSHWLAELERRAGRKFPRQPLTNLTVEDHQKNSIPITEQVMIPVNIHNRTTYHNFVIHITTDSSPFERALLGAPYIESHQVEARWQGPRLMLSQNGEKDTEITTVREPGVQSVNKLQAHALAFNRNHTLASTIKKTQPVGQTQPSVQTCSSRGTTVASGDGIPRDKQVTAEDSPRALVDAAAHTPGSQQQDGKGRHLSSCLREDRKTGPRNIVLSAPTAPAFKHKTQNKAENKNDRSSALEALPKTTNTGTTKTEANKTTDTTDADAKEAGVPSDAYEVASPMPTKTNEALPSDWKEVFDIYTVSEEYRDFMEEFLTKNSHILALHATDVGENPDPKFEFTIETVPGFVMPRMKPYSAPPPARQLIRDIINDWLRMGVIVEATDAKGCYPLFLVPKKVPKGANKERSLILVARPVIDFRPLNAKTATWPQTVPNPVHSMEKLKGKQVFSKIDYSNAFHNLTIRKEDQWKTTFITPDYKVYKFRRMPFGLKNAATAFQNFITSILSPLGDDCVVYLDDVILASHNEEDHKKLLECFAEIIKKYNLRISPKKCEFFKNQVQYLSFVCDGEGVRVSPEKVKAIEEFERPKNLAQTQAFVGLANWLSRFIPRFQSLSVPLTNLSKKEAKFEWTEECEENFKRIKEAVAKATQLYHADYTKDFHIWSDASKTAGGAGLFQFKDGTPKQIEESADPDPQYLQPVAFHSRKFSEVQTRYGTLEQEILALLDALKAFSYYTTYAPKICVHTDAKSITWLLSFNYHSDNVKLMRYSMRLLGHENLEIRHCSGKMNQLADALSRQWGNPEPLVKRRNPREMKREDVNLEVKDGQKLSLGQIIKKIEENPAIVQKLSASTKTATVKRISTYFKKFTVEYLAQEQAADEFCRKIVDNIRHQQNQANERYKFQNGLLVRKKDKNKPWDMTNMLTVVPKTCQALVIAFFHSYGHLGAKRLHKFLSSYYWFPKAAQLCRDFARGCKVCQALNRHRHGLQETTNMELASAPNDCWSMDFMTITKSGRVQHILNIQDQHSGFLMSFGTPDQKVPQVIKALTTCFQLLGVPKQLRSDHGRSLLEAAAVKRLCEEWGVQKLALGIPNIPTKNSKVERCNQSVRGILKALSLQYGAAFHEMLPVMNYIYNATPHRFDDISPYEIYMGRKIRVSLPTVPEDPQDVHDHMETVRRRRREIQRKIDKIQEKNRREDLRKVNKNRKHLHITEGDLVLLLDLSTPTQGQRSKKDRPTYLKQPFLVRKRLQNLLILENVLDNRILHASVNHVKKLVGRGKVFRDLPQQFRLMFGHPFRAWDLIGADIPAEVKADFTNQLPPRDGMTTRRQARAAPAPQNGRDRNDENKSDSDDYLSDSDDNNDDNGGDAPAVPVPQAAADPGPSTSRTVWTRVNDTRKSLGRRARLILKLKRNKVSNIRVRSNTF